MIYSRTKGTRETLLSHPTILKPATGVFSLLGKHSHLASSTYKLKTQYLVLTNPLSFLTMITTTSHNLNYSEQADIIHISYKTLCEVDKELADYLDEDHRLYLNDFVKI